MLTSISFYQTSLGWFVVLVGTILDSYSFLSLWKMSKEANAYNILQMFFKEQIVQIDRTVFVSF